MKLRKLLALLLALAFALALAACSGPAATEDGAEDGSAPSGETQEETPEDTELPEETPEETPEDTPNEDTPETGLPEDGAAETLEGGETETPADGGTDAPAEIPQEAQAMLPIFDSILLASDGTTAHSALYIDYFWSVLYHILSNHSDLLTATGENDGLYVRQSVQECAAAAFGDYSDLPIDTLVPEEHGLSYDEGWDAFALVWMSDRSATETTITAWNANGDGTYTAEAVLTSEEGAVVSTATFTLKDNPYADGIADPLFLYTVTDANVILTGTVSEQATGELVGQVDSHSVEVMIDGEAQVFQCSETLATQLGGMDPGSVITFSYTTDSATGVKTIEGLMPSAR